MKRIQQFTAIIEREGDGYVAWYSELDIASQRDSIRSTIAYIFPIALL